MDGWTTHAAWVSKYLMNLEILFTERLNSITIRESGCLCLVIYARSDPLSVDVAFHGYCSVFVNE